ncbi:MAG: hypothetical protein E7488_01955 [Ruminococcaceae bacterium]|nr:hypothetical protein [Oscillospiraceae bacterium]
MSKNNIYAVNTQSRDELSSRGPNPRDQLQIDKTLQQSNVGVIRQGAKMIDQTDIKYTYVPEDRELTEHHHRADLNSTVYSEYENRMAEIAQIMGLYSQLVLKIADDIENALDDIEAADIRAANGIR